MRQWRVIYDPPTAGPRNMAVDVAIMQSVATGDSPPTLRLYAWQPACLSLGYGQKIRDVDQYRLKAHGWQLVRRPTGGKAILHTDELTYSVVLPLDHDLAQGDIITSYHRLSRALIHALQYLGLSPRSEKQPQSNRAIGPVCFEVPSHYEITADGRKLIGSAQMRRRDGLLQHGSLPLYGDIARICEVLSYATDDERQRAKEQVRSRATTLEAVTGRQIAWQTAADALVKGFAEAFDLDISRGTLSPAEEQAAQSLLENTYTTDTWIHKR